MGIIRTVWPREMDQLNPEWTPILNKYNKLNKLLTVKDFKDSRDLLIGVASLPREKCIG